ncbi:hypothetical protein B0O99DRAFT_303093 [Bisporella sp. PMI_857]|nr:hypothetical protein B0O99DRAFT_303093 [Bisporella sp. PMI_857]
MPSPVLSWEDFTGMLTMQYELFTSFDQLELRHEGVLSSFKSLIDSARLLRKATEALPRAIHIYSTYEDAFYIICCVAAGSPTVLGKVKEKNFFNEIGRLYKSLRTKHGKVQKLKLPSNLRPKQSKIVPENEIARWRLGADDSILPGDAKSGNTLHDEPESAVVQDSKQKHLRLADSLTLADGLKHPRESTTEPEDRQSKSQRLSSPRATIEGEQVSDGDGISRSAGEEQRPLLRQQHSTHQESDASILGQQLPSFVVAESELQPPCNNGVQSVNRGNASKPQRLESHSADDVTERSERALDIHGDGTTESTGEAQGSLLRQQCDSHQESDSAIHGDPPNSGHPFLTSSKSNSNLQVLLTPAETLYNSPYNDQRTLPTPRSASSMKSIENTRHNNQQNKYPEYSAHSGE